mmetsp:Transcript_10715/g.19433  ORF Transcript_10715/g.19433 Transcript_10715/m.19433 type:complete len:613 (+) Transcript_10715:85-1923(+)
MASIIHSQANIAREYILSYTMDTGKVMIDQDLGCAPNGSDAICDTPQEIVANMENWRQPNDAPSLFVNTDSNPAPLPRSFSADVDSLQDLSIRVRDPMLSLPLLFCALLIIALVTLRKLCYKQKQPNMFLASTKLPPCTVPPHFIYGHIPHVNAPPESAKFRSVFVDHANASGISTFWFMNTPCVSVLKAEHVRICLRNSIERPGVGIFSKHFKMCLGRDSILMMEGGENDREKWRQHRNLIKVAFTKKAVDNMANKVWKVANGFVSSILRECAKNNSDHDQDTKQQRGSYHAEAEEIFRWATLDIFGEVALNYNFGCTDTLTTTPLAHSLNYTIEDSNVRIQVANLLNPAYQFYWFPTQRNRDYKYHSENVRGLMREICQQRVQEIDNSQNNIYSEGDGEATKQSGDLLTALLKSKMESEGTKLDENHDKLVQMLMTLFFAGYDTSSIVLSMAMWSIAKNPEIQKECAREAKDASTSSSTRTKTSPSKSSSEQRKRSLHEDASQWESRLAYCQAVILETTRLHPPAYTNYRVFDKDVKLDGCTIPRRTRVYLPLPNVHTDERNFARPTEFLPERWVRRDPGTGQWVARDYESEQEPKFAERDNDPEYVPGR